MKPDYEYWREFKHDQWRQRRFARPKRAALTALVAVTESEQNGTQATADAVTGFGSAADPVAQLSGSLSTNDVDFFSFPLRAGDVISAAVPGARTLELRAPNGTLLVRSNIDASFVYPAQSPLPGDRTAGAGAAFSYVVATAGTYALSVSGTTGAYLAELEVYRPTLDAGGTQVVFIDFDGAEVDGALFDAEPGPKRLSPLSAFLAGFGLARSDEDAVINAIMASVRESLSADLRSRGLNPNVALDLRNSRDHVDAFGDTHVSRVIVGGTIAELGLETIGIAQSIDPGNFATQETAVVLLDLLSSPAGTGSSLHEVQRAAGVSMIALVGSAVGNIVAHEAGHYLGDFHTTNANTQANIMDEGGNLPNTIGLGADGIFGTSDDPDVDFGLDVYSTSEGFVGSEDTLNTVAFGVSGRTALGSLTLRPNALCGGLLRVELRDSNATSATLGVSASSGTGDSEQLTLTRSSAEAGLYTGQVQTVQAAAAPNDGRLQIQIGSSVSVTYNDVNDGTGSPRAVLATASVDCQSPSVTNLQVRELSDIDGTLFFTTSEPASTRVDFGTACNQLARSESGPLATSHRLALGGLTPNTTYFYALSATDAIGNTTRLDNGGSCYSFRTAASTRVFYRDFAGNLGGFSVSQSGGALGWHVTSACADALPGHTQPGVLYFGDDSSCNCESGTRSSGSATSPAFTVAGNVASKLRFNYLLATRQIPLFETTRLEISVNGRPFEVVASNGAGTLPETQGAFRKFALDLSPYLGGAASASVAVRFSFDTLDSAGNEFAGFYVDDVEVVTLGAGTECTSAQQCDDGLFCTGAEACLAGRCVRGRAACSDGVDCTIDSCNESARSCVNAPNVFTCLDATGCDGFEYCKPGVGCVEGTPPCVAGEICEEAGLQCLPPCQAAIFVAGFQREEIGNFDITPTVTVNSTAGDHPGATGSLGADIDDSGSITTYQGLIDAHNATTLTLSYWMDVQGFDAGEVARVQYCTQGCELASGWITLTSVGGTTGWRQYQHTLPTSARTDTLQLRWESSGNGINEWVHIDDILLRDGSCGQPLPPFNPRPPVLGSFDVGVNASTGLVTFSGTASDPDGDLAFAELFLSGPNIPFLSLRARATSSFSTQLYLGPGEYFTLASLFDKTGLSVQSSERSFVVPQPGTTPPPGPLFEESFEQAGLSQFSFQGAVTVNNTAGDHPGASGTLGADIDDSGRIVTRAIDAASASGTLRLSYWMDVNNFDANEFGRVSFCSANCTNEASWTLLQSVGGTSGWVAYQHTLPAAAKSATLQLRWVSSGNGTLEYVHIDDIRLTSTP